MIRFVPKKSLLSLLLLMVFVHCHLNAQTVQVNSEALQEIVERENAKFEKEKAEALREAEKNGWPISFTGQDSTEYELIRVENGTPIFYQTLNITAAASTSTNHVWPGGRAGLNLDGSGMTMREWDGGGTRTTHQEFGSRVTQVDNPSGLSNHATHVAGTLVAAGAINDAKGMAHAADLRAFDWNSDNSEMASEAAMGALVSQHSYGQIAGWANGNWSGNQGWHWWGSPSISQNEDWSFGFYDGKTSTWDEIAENAPYYLIVKSSGNNRGGGPGPNTFHYVWNNGWQTSTTTREVMGGSDGFDCIPTYGTAKNILTVGAVFDVPNGYSQPSDVQMSSFSSWGPTDDGRIKPDVVGNGVAVFSSYAGNNSQYATISGTSMSGPNVSGSLLLLQQLHDSLNNQYMRSASLRGLAIHTADESGPNTGPDYMFGWGLLNIEKAAELLLDTVQSFVMEEELVQGDTFRYAFESNGVDPIHVTLCWTDPSAPANTPSLNPTNIKLINDLDVRIVSPTDASVNEMPWILNPANPSAAATRGDNIRDNVEVIPAGVLPAGAYEIVVTHKGSLQSLGSSSTASQPFSLIASGVVTSVCAFTSLSVDLTLTDSILCFGDSTAALTASISGGVPPYSLTWNEDPSLNGTSLQDLPEGTYTVEVIDSLGCVALDTFNINQPDELTASAIVVDHVSCFGGDDGRARAEVLGGTPPYALSWDSNPIQTSDTADGLVAGTYALTVTDANSCVVIASVSINEPSDSITVDVSTVSDVSCFDGSDGSASVDVNGGTPPYSYQWNTTPVQASDSITGLPQGTYTVTVTDANNCTATKDVFIDQPADSITVDVLSVNHVRCFGGNEGSASINASGGTPPYNVEWNTTPVQTSDSATGLSAGAYTATVTDANNCVADVSVTIVEPADSIAVTVVSQQNASCRNDSDGFIVVDAVGGHPPFTYEWNNDPSLNTDSLGGLAAGSYVVTVTDSQLCTQSLTVIITEPSRLNASVISKSDVSCFGAEDGVIDINVSGGTPPMTFDWSHGASTSTVIGLSEGTYTVVVTDANGCTDTLSRFINEPNTFPIGMINGSDFTGPMEVESYDVMAHSGAAYDWTVQGGSIIAGQGTNSVDVEWSQVGVHELSVTATAVDTCDESTLVVTVSPTFSTEDEWLSKVQVYPNPTQGVLTIVLPDPAVAELIELFDAVGKRVFATKEIFEEQQVDLSFLASGAYTLRIGAFNQRILLTK